MIIGPCTIVTGGPEPHVLEEGAVRIESQGAAVTAWVRSRDLEYRVMLGAELGQFQG